MIRFGSTIAIVGVALWSGGSQAWAQQAGAGAAAQQQAGAAQNAAGAAGQTQTGAAVQTQAGAGVATPGAQTGVQSGAQFGAMNNFGGISQTPWFANPAARQQLQLNDQQFNQMNQLYQQRYTQYKREIGDIINQDLSPDQRRTQVQQLQQQFRQGFSQGFDEQFGQSPFRNRYNQLDRQYQGFAAFSDPQIQQQLNLTAGQQQQIQRLSADWQSELQGMSQANVGNQQALQGEMTQLRQRLNRRLQSILSRDQLRDWEQLIGDPFDFPAEMYFQNSANGQVQQGQQVPPTQPQPGQQAQPGQVPPNQTNQ